MKLREWTIEDAESLAKYANNVNVAKYLTNQFPHPYTIQNANDFIKKTKSYTPTTIFAIEVNGEAVGGIGLHQQDDIFALNMELGYWLGEPFWRQGITAKAVNQMVKYGFKHFSINRIYARPFSNNIGSQKVLEKCGFKLEAKLNKTILKNGELLDELIYAIRQ